MQVTHPLHLLALRHIQTLKHHHNLVQSGFGGHIQINSVCHLMSVLIIYTAKVLRVEIFTKKNQMFGIIC